MPRFIDSHCHIDKSEFTPIDSTLQICHDNRISDLIVPGLHETQWQHLVQLAETHKPIHIAFGRHPWWINNDDDPTEFATTLSDYIERQPCIAIGETGMDGLRATDLTLQQLWFKQHLDAAANTQKPVIIHAVKAHGPIQHTLARYKGQVRGVIHGFTGGVELARQYWKLGFHLGIGGHITYPRGSKTHQAIQSLPLEAFLLETDAPDMPLYGHQGKPNHPVRLIDVAKKVAELKTISLNEVAQITTQNCLDLFLLEQ